MIPTKVWNAAVALLMGGAKSVKLLRRGGAYVLGYLDASGRYVEVVAPV